MNKIEKHKRKAKARKAMLALERTKAETKRKEEAFIASFITQKPPPKIQAKPEYTHTAWGKLYLT